LIALPEGRGPPFLNDLVWRFFDQFWLWPGVTLKNKNKTADIGAIFGV